MKLLLLSLLIQHFSIQNGSVIWQQTYSTSLTQTQFLSAVKTSGVLESIEVDGNTITGRVNNLTADFKGAGYSEMRTPMYIARNTFSGFASITFTEGEYTVTFKRIQLEATYSDAFNQKGEKTTLEYWLLNKPKTEIKKSKNMDIEILDYTFISLFKF